MAQNVLMFMFSYLQHLAKHVMRVHLNALQSEDTVEGELSLSMLKKFIAYARTYVQLYLP